MIDYTCRNRRQVHVPLTIALKRSTPGQCFIFFVYIMGGGGGGGGEERSMVALKT